ncbi:hypothetical protein ACOTCI_04750 [Achromobacter xylosoxidans]
MENSFVKGYEKSESQDGSIVYKFKSAKINEIPFITFFGPASLLLSWAVIGYNLKEVEKGWLISLILAIVIAVFFIRWAVYKKEEFTIVAKKGLKLYNGKTIPFSDLNNVYVANINQKGTIQAETNGKRITVVRLISLPLARLILDDILSQYGSWKEEQ